MRYGVSMAIEQHYSKFYYDIHEKQHNINSEKLIASTYGHTYWYYFMFKK